MKHKVEVIPKKEILANRCNAYEFMDFDKKETIEEAFNRIFDSIDYILFDYTSFEQGAKWQKEQDKKMYSELVDLLERLRPIYKEDSVSHFKCEKQRINIIEQFKNK